MGKNSDYTQPQGHVLTRMTGDTTLDLSYRFQELLPSSNLTVTLPNPVIAGVEYDLFNSSNFELTLISEDLNDVCTLPAHQRISLTWCGIGWAGIRNTTGKQTHEEVWIEEISPIHSIGNNAKILKIDATHYLFAGKIGAVMGLHVGTLSGTTITEGTLENSITADVFCDVVLLSSTLFVAQYVTSDILYWVAGTISGTTITMGTPVAASGGGVHVGDTAQSLVKLGATKFGAVYNDSVDGMYTVIGDVAGTVITMGTEVVVESNLSYMQNDSFGAFDINGTSNYMIYKSKYLGIGSQRFEFKVITFTGNTPNITGSWYNVDNGLNLGYYISTVVLDTSNIGVVWYGSKGVASDEQLQVGVINVSGTVITHGTFEVLRSLATGDVTGVTAMLVDSNNFIISAELAGGSFIHYDVARSGTIVTPNVRMETLDLLYSSSKGDKGIALVNSTDYIMHTNASATYLRKSHKNVYETHSAIQTDAPSGGTSQPWKLGQLETDGSALTISPTDYVEIEINGVVYKLGVVS